MPVHSRGVKARIGAIWKKIGRAAPKVGLPVGTDKTSEVAPILTATAQALAVHATPVTEIYGSDSFFQTRSASVTPQAWASQPRCACGASPSRISGIWPTQPSNIN